MEMEVKHKVPVKILSLFLSVVLAFSCFSIAFNGFLPGASAAASSSQWTTLKNAFDTAKAAGVLSSANATNVSASATAVTITDDTDGSYYWNIVVALQAVMNAERSSYSNNPQLSSDIQNNGTLALNSYQKNFVAQVITTAGNLVYYNGNRATTGSQSTDQENSYNYPSMGATYGSFTTTYKVTRTLKAAILAQSSMPADNTNLQTTATFTGTQTNQITTTDSTGTYPSNWTTGSGTDKSSHSCTHYTVTRTRYEWYACTAISGISYGYSSTGTTLSALRNYINYVNATYFATPYNNWLTDSSSVYFLSESILNSLPTAYNTVYNAINSTDSAYIEKFLSGGVATKEKQKNFADACKGALEAVQYKKYVDWITTNGYHAVTGDIAHDDHSFAYDDEAKYNNNVALRTQAENYLKEINKLSESTRTALTDVYGYSESDYTDLISELTDDIEKYEIDNILEQIEFRINHDDTECFDGDTSLFGVTNYESAKYEGAWTESTDDDGNVVMTKNSPENWPMTDDQVSTAKSWFSSKYDVLSNNYKAANVTTVSDEVYNGDVTLSVVNDWKNKLTVEADYRDIEEDYNYNFYEYFEPIMRGIDYNAKSDKAVEEAISTLEAKLTSLNSLYSKATSQLGATKRDQIFGTYPTTVQNYINSLYNILYTRLYNQEYNMVYRANDHDDSTPADEINDSNFSLVKRGIADFDYYKGEYDSNGNPIDEDGNVVSDTTLYYYVTTTKASKYNSLVGTSAVNQLKTWKSWVPTYQAKIAEVMEARWTSFTQVKLDSPADSGIYTTRYVDAYGADMVRDDPSGNGADKYVVTETKINTVVTKLDTFVNSADFTKLIGVYDEEAGITSLGGYFDNLLTEVVFSDDIINLLISMLLPMVCNVLETQLPGMLQDLTIGGYNCSTTTKSGWTATLDLQKILLGANGSTTFSSGSAKVEVNSGSTVDIAMNGAQSTNTVKTEFNNLGLYIYPDSFGNQLPSTVNGVSLSAIKSDLSKAGSSGKGMGGWLYFDTINPTYTTTDKDTGETVTVDRRTEDGGNTYNDGELSQEDFMAYKWGCKDFDTFCSALAAVFNCIKPLVQCLFTNYTFSKSTTNNFIKIYVDGDLDASYSFLSASADLKGTGTAGAKLTIAGIQGYNDLWAPLFEDLGISTTTSGYDVSLSAPLSSTIGTAGSGASVEQIVKALIMPVYALINKLDTAPVSTLASILPMAAMAISYDMITPLFQVLKLSLTINDADVDLDFDEVELWGWLSLTWIANIFSSSIGGLVEDAIDFSTTIDLSSTLEDVVSEDNLGFDITDLNSIANFVVSKVFSSDEESDDLAISLPSINSGKLAHLGQLQTLSSLRSTNYNSSLGSKQRYYIKARQADVVYDLVSWVLDFVAVEGNLSGLMVTLGQSTLDADISKIIGAVDAQGALAALVELFLPQDYAFEDYDWYTPNSADSTFTFGSSADFVYTKYGNDWTEDKAEYMYDELETVANAVIEIIDSSIYEDIGVSGINELAQYYINSMFNNDGVMNIINLFTGIGESLADQTMIVNLVKEQLQSNGISTNIDLLSWYNTFGYLTFDYDELADEIAEIKADSTLTADEKTEKIADLEATAPAKPTDADYVNSFPNLSVTTNDKIDENGEVVKDDNGNAVTEYHWSYRTGTSAAWQALEDNSANARQIFTHIFCELVRPVSPILDLILCGKDLSAFAGAIVINGYDCYESAIIPVLETLGIKDLMTQAEYNAYSEKNGADAAFDYLVNKLFDYVKDLLTIETKADGTEYGPVQKLIDLLPRVFYFLQSDGLTTLIKNLLHPIWCVIDTLRPIVNADIDGIVHLFLVKYLGLCYDTTDTVNYPTSVIADFVMDLLGDSLGFEEVTYDATKAAEDKSYVDGIWSFTIEDLSMPAIANLLKICFGIDMTPAIYAFEGMCVATKKNGVTYGVKDYTSKGDTDWTWQSSTKGWKELDYYGPDTITVTLCAFLDLVRYGDNEAALDKMLGLTKELSPDAQISGDFTASGLLEALTVIFEDQPVALTGESPNWDYLLENKSVKLSDGTYAMYNDVVDGKDTSYLANMNQYTGLNIQEYHSLYQLDYVTDWQPEIADNMDALLSESLDYIVSLVDANDGGATTLSEFVDNLLRENLFTGEVLKKLADLIGQLYDTVPVDVVKVIDNLLDVNITGWMKYVKLQTVTDDEGNPVLDEDGNEKQSYQADPDHPWWSDPESDSYVDTADEFYDAVNEMLQACAPVFGYIFLGNDYRLFRTIGEGVDSDSYGDDAIVINGLNAYSRGLIPILEALGCDLTDYKPAKYVNADGSYNSELFVSDIFKIVKGLIDEVLADPYEYIIDTLPNLIYFANAGGFSTSLKNILGSVQGVIDAINTMMPEGEEISLAMLSDKLEGIDLSNITLDTIFALLQQFTGLYIRNDLSNFIKTLYVGVLEEYTSANGLGAYRMNLNKTYLDTETGRYTEGRGDFITIFLSLIVEIITDEGTYIDEEGNEVAYSNPKAINTLVNGEDAIDIASVIELLKNPTDPKYLDIDWDYFDETLNLSDSTDNVVNIKPYQFLYLNYTTDWTEAKADDVVDQFDELLLAALKMIDSKYESATSASDIITDMLSLDTFFTAETLQKILDLVSPLLYGDDAVLPEALLNMAGALLGADLTEWDYTYEFTDRDTSATYTLDTETNLKYTMVTSDVTGEAIKAYAIDDRDDFVNGLTLILNPANRILSWILFGDDYEFFIKNTDATETSRLITIKGAEGYRYGLSLLLEALGIDSDMKRYDKYLENYNAVDGTFTGVNMSAFIADLLQSLCSRMDEIIKDPVTEVEGLISELLYFINAGGLQVSIQNLAEAALNLLDGITEAGIADLDIDSLLNGLINSAVNGDKTEDDADYVNVNFSLDKINLEYIFTLVETFTGLKLNEVVGNTLEYFKIGDVYAYASNSGLLAYKCRFTTEDKESFADFVTILLSFVIDVFEYEGNAEALAKLINSDSISAELLTSIATFLRESYTVTNKTIDWFYFDETYSLYNADGTAKDTAPTVNADTALTVTENTINNLTYASNWTKESATAIYQNRNELISSVLDLVGLKDDKGNTYATLGDLINDKLDLNEILYTKENLEKILDLVKSVTTGLDDSIKEVLNIVIDVDLSAYDTMTVGEVDSRTSFAGELNKILQPVARVLDWLLFGDDIQYFDKKEADGIRVLINLPGADGYSSALIPILETLGVTLPTVKAGDTCDDVLYVLINNVLARVETILSNPVDEVLAMLPNIIYFINTNGLATCINNLLSPAVALLDEIGPSVGIGTLDELISSLLEGSDIKIDINNLDWLAILEIVEKFTGIEITDVVTSEKIDNFYFGDMEAYDSANGNTAFKMVYSETQGPADMLTFVLNFLVEVLTYTDETNGIDNAKAIDELVGTDGIVDSVVAILTEGAPVDDSAYVAPTWAYYKNDTTADLGAVDVPTNAFIYLDYSNDWTYTKAMTLTSSLNDLVAGVLELTGSDVTSVSDLLNGLLPLDDYLTADSLNKILDLIATYLYGEDSIINEALASVIQVVLGSDLTAWDGKYTFVGADAVTSSYILDEETGLKAKTEAGKTYYAITTRAEFVKGLCKILKPAEPILAFLLLGQNYGFFVDSATGAKTLLNVYGGDGYTTALTLLLEALGCENLPKIDTTKLAEVDVGELLEGVFNSVLARVDEIMADPVNEVIDLIPELIYFINAGGLNSVVKNFTAGINNLLENLAPVIGSDTQLDLDSILTDLIKSVYESAGKTVADDFKFTTSDVNIEWAMKLVKDLTGIDIHAAIGTAYPLEKLAIGNITKYDTASRFDAYKAVLAPYGDGTDAQRDRADVITITLTLALEVVMYNSAAIEDLTGLSAGTIDAIAALIKSHTVEKHDINWFYFDKTVDAKNVKADTVITMPKRTINYIEYMTDWTEETADTIDANLDSIISAVLEMTGSEETTVAAILEQYFTLDELYTADNLNAISSMIANLISSLDESIVKVAGVLLDCDLASYTAMEFEDDQIVGRESFEAGLVKVIKPIYAVLDWLFFGDSIKVFYNNEAYGDVNADGTKGYDVIDISGYEGYRYGLVPILEALGVELPEYVSGASTAEDIIPGMITGILDFAEKVLADPVNEALAMIPNLLYFINANGLSASVQNLIGAVTCLLGDVKNTLDKLGVDIGDYDLTSTQALVDSVLASVLEGTEYEGKITVDLDNITLGAIADIITNITGIKIKDVLVENGIENFYLGEVVYFASSTGDAAFRMQYTETEGRAELITIVINLLVDVLLYDGNAETIDELVGTDGTVTKIVNLIKTLANADIKLEDVDWNYFGGTVTGEYLAANSTITPPATAFNNYLTYTSDWSKETANFLYNNLGTIADAVISMIGSIDADSVSEFLSGSVNLYQGKFLNTIVEAIQKLYDVLPEQLIPVIDSIIGTDINGWKDLSYEDKDMTAPEFVAALEEILEPAYSLLDWLLFGDDLEYFVQDKTAETLVKIPGNYGYAGGLAVILEALGVELPDYDVTTASCETMMKAILTAVTVRIAEIFNNPVDEVLELLPNLLYNINAAAVTTAVKNLLGSVIAVLPDIGELLGKDITLENILPELVGIDLNLANLDLTEILTFVESLDALKGLKIVEVFTGNVTDNGDGTFTFTQDPDGDTNLLENFYLGNAAQYKSNTGYAMYRMDYTEANKGDLLTMLLSIVLQVAIYDDNAAPLAALIGNDAITADTITALIQLLTSGAVTEMADINWTYYLGLTDQAEIDAYIQKLASEGTTAINGIQIKRTSNYLKYSNNWNEETASYLSDNLDSIVDCVINLVTNMEYADLDSFLNSVDVINNLYSDDTVDWLVGKIANALNNVIEKTGTEIFDAAGKLLSVDILAVVNYKSSGVHDKATFAKSLADAFSPLGEVLDWLLFNREYTFFTKLENGEKSIIKLNGGEGFKYGLAPVLEAIGVDTHIEDLVAAATDDKSITEQVLEPLLENVCDRIDDILANPIDEVFDLLPELIYFINADGATVSVGNLLAPIDALLAKVADAIGNKNISSLAKVINQPIIADLSFESILALVKDKTGVDVYGAIGEYLTSFYFGQLTHYTSYDSVDGFRMGYSDTEERHDFITILLTMVLDVATYEGNSDFIINLLDDKLVKNEDKDENKTKAKNMYYSALALLTDNYDMVEMQDFDWLFVTKEPIHTEWVDSKIAVSPLMTGSEFDYLYGPLYKRAMGEYITKWLPDFVDTMIVLLGIKGADGLSYSSLEDMLNGLLSGSIYTNDILDKLLTALQSVYPLIENAMGEELAAHVATVLNDSLGVDLTYWNNYTVATIANGDRTAFVNEVVKMLRPAYPILKWLLVEGNDIAFFNEGTDGSDYIVLESADGYAYSIVPILEALHCDGIVSPAQYAADTAANDDAVLSDILTPLLDKVDEIMADPVNEILEVATSAIYFLNSNAADTCFKNLLNAVYSLLNAIEPITGEINLYELIGLDLETFNIESLIGQLLESVEEEYGFKLTAPALEAIKELTVGYLYSFTSLNGRQAYSMELATGADATDLVTVVLRFIMVFVSDPDNVVGIEAILKDKLSDEGYTFVCALLDNFSTMCGTSEGMDTVMYTIYYIFYAANVAAHETENGIAEFNGNYSFLDQLFATSDLAFFRQLESSFASLFQHNDTKDVIDNTGVMTNGAIPFFQKIINFFQKILAFFQNLFK